MNPQLHFPALGEVKSVLTGQSIFLVADSVAYVASGAEAILRPVLANRTVAIFDSFEPNPKLPEAEACAAALRESEADTILAVGGGTVMGVAKLANWLVAQNAGKEEILQANGWRLKRRCRSLPCPPPRARAVRRRILRWFMWMAKNIPLRIR
jgi:alcohol dehydrogenase class IV